jgi:hypothetical protein
MFPQAVLVIEFHFLLQVQQKLSLQQGQTVLISLFKKFSLVINTWHPGHC